MAAKAVLLTGATGLVGEAVCCRLLADGRELLAPWAPDPPTLELRGVTWVPCDLERAEAVQRLGEVEAVVHLAAALPASHGNSAQAADTNRAIDENILALCAARGVPLVYASSVAVYGPASSTEAEPLRESAPVDPAGAYAQEKAWAEREGRRRLGERGLPFTALRLCAPYGPRQWRGSVIQRFIERALDGGPLHYLGDGSREQSFTHVRDIACAFRAALRGPGGTFNITAAQPITMQALGLLVARCAGLDETVVAAAGQPDPLEGERARYDISAAQEALGWSPQIALDAGVRECLRTASWRRTRCD